MAGKNSVLLVEDGLQDAALVRGAFQRLRLVRSLAVLTNGRDALVRMAVDPPSLVLLDLNLPGVDGFGVLIRRLAQHKLLRIPVVVFSGTASPRQVIRAKELGANAFVRRAGDLEGLVRDLRAIEAFWLEVDVAAE